MSYGQGRGQTNKLTKETIGRMRNTNVVYGTDDFAGNTTYKCEFGWKKNDDF